MPVSLHLIKRRMATSLIFFFLVLSTCSSAAQTAEENIDFSVEFLEDSWPTIYEPNIRLLIKNNSDFMLAIDVIEASFPGNNTPLMKTNYSFSNWNDEVIFPNREKILNLKVDPLSGLKLSTLFYRSKVIDVQFHFHPGGAQRWPGETELLKLKPSAPFQAVFLGGIFGVIANIILVYLLENTLRAPVHLTLRYFLQGSIVTFLSIYVLRAIPSSTLGTNLQQAGFFAIDFNSGFIIGLSFMVIIPIFKKTLNLAHQNQNNQ